MRHCLDTTDFTVEEIDDLIHLATDIIADPKKYAHVCDGKNWQPCFLSRRHAPACLLKRR